MNVQVLGSDYPQEIMGDWWQEWGAPIVKTVIPIVGQEVGKRLNPTQKAAIQQVTGTSSSLSTPPPPKKTFMEENGTYLIIGGVLLVGVVVIMKTRSRRR